MKKKLLSAALAVVMVLSMVPGAFAVEAVTANPTNDKLTVNGVPQTPTVYKIGSSNYFKIRDVAAVLNGTDKQFSVGYSGGKVTVTTGQPYEATGKELSGAPASAREATRSNDAILVNGQEASLTVYKIGGSNYFKLRDLGKALGFDVDWTAAQGMMITTGGTAQTTTPPAGTVAYYKDHPNVPDFGIFSGTPLARGMDRENGYAYLYDVSKVPSGTDIIKPYGDLLMEKGYQYVGSQEYNDGRLLNFSKGQETVNFGFVALDDGGYYVVEILQETTLTPGTVAYYKDYPTVPDFGAYLGIPCNNAYTDTKGDQHYEGGTLYDYDIDKVQAKLASLYDGYIDLLKQSGFQYGKTYTADDGNSREIYTNGSIELEVGAAETGKDAYYSVVVMVRKPVAEPEVEAPENYAFLALQYIYNRLKYPDTMQDITVSCGLYDRTGKSSACFDATHKYYGVKVSYKAMNSLGQLVSETKVFMFDLTTGTGEYDLEARVERAIENSWGERKLEWMHCRSEDVMSLKGGGMLEALSRESVAKVMEEVKNLKQ